LSKTSTRLWETLFQQLLYRHFHSPHRPACSVATSQRLAAIHTMPWLCVNFLVQI
jgi:hypothetical protein